MQHTPTDHNTHPVAILGAGPVGLAAAAHLLEQGLETVLFEAGSGPGTTFRDVSHVRLFSPWRYNIDAASARLLDSIGWTHPAPEDLPTGGELVQRYLEPLAAHPEIARRAHFATRVVGVARERFDRVRTQGRDEQPFSVRVRNLDGGLVDHPARAVIDTTGTWQQPNPLGANGLPALGETAVRSRIAYGMPDILGAQRAQHAGRTILVAGAGHSAAGSLLALAELAAEAPDTRIHWAVRGAVPQRLLGDSATDNLPARGAIGEKIRALLDAGRLRLHTHFPIRSVQLRDGRLRVLPAGDRAPVEGVDRIIAATGARPDPTLLREVRADLDPALESVRALAPLIDPNEHDCGTVPPHGHRELIQPEPGLFIAGAKSYGRAPTFLMVTGYEQVRSIAAALADDHAAADDVRLELPETGVCAAPGTERGAACCATPASC